MSQFERSSAVGVVTVWPPHAMHLVTSRAPCHRVRSVEPPWLGQGRSQWATNPIPCPLPYVALPPWCGVIAQPLSLSSHHRIALLLLPSRSRIMTLLPVASLSMWVCPLLSHTVALP